MKKRCASFLLIFLFIFTLMPGLQKSSVKAAENDFKVEVTVITNEKVLVQGLSQKATVVESIEDVLAQNNIEVKKPKGYIEEVAGLIGGKTLSPNSGWMYEVNRGGSYVDSPWDAGFSFKKGDRVVFYFGDYTVTQKADKISYSTTLPDTKLTIAVENSFAGPINGIKAKVFNSKYQSKVYFDAAITDNKINLPAGLPEGNYTLELSDYKAEAFPKVIADHFNFAITAAAPNNNAPVSLYDRDNLTVKKELSSELALTADYVSKNLSEEPWTILSMSKLGSKASTAYLKAAAAQVKKDKGLKEFSNTEVEKLIILLTAAGYTPYDFMGYNAVEELYSRDINKFLINDAVYGLMAMNYANIPGNFYNITREKLVDYILSKKLSYKSDKEEITGWSLGNKIDIDITGLAINALSTEYDKNNLVREAVDAAVKSISILQNNSGYVLDSFGYSSESISVVILGLTSIGVDPEGAMFQKPKGDLISALLSFKGTNGQFKHNLDGSNDSIATEQALRALIALKEFKTAGKYNYYKSEADSSKLGKFSVTDKELLELGVLPQTGSVVDTTAMNILGILFIAAGVIIIRSRKTIIK